MDVTTHRLLRTFLHRSHVTSRLRCSLRPTEPIRAAIATSTGDGRLLARCQLAAGCCREYAICHFAHEAGKEIQQSGTSDGHVLERVEGMCWLTTGALCGRRGTNKARFVTQVLSMRL